MNKGARCDTPPCSLYRSVIHSIFFSLNLSLAIKNLSFLRRRVHIQHPHNCPHHEVRHPLLFARRRHRLHKAIISPYTHALHPSKHGINHQNNSTRHRTRRPRRRQRLPHLHRFLLHRRGDLIHAPSSRGGQTCPNHYQ